MQYNDKYPPEVHEPTVRMVLDNTGQPESRWAAIMSVSEKIGCAADTLNKWIKNAEVDGSKWSSVATDMSERPKALEAMPVNLCRPM